MNVRMTLGKSIRAQLALLLTSLLVSGCITTTEGGFTEKASPEKALEQRVSLARQYIGEGNAKDAKRNLQIAHDLDPNSADVHEAFALVFQSTGEYERAEESFRKSVRLDKSCSRCRNNFAAFLYSQKNYKEAVSQLEKVVKDTLYPARGRAFINLGLSRQQLQDAQGAEEAFERAIAMDRTNSTAALALAEYRFDAQDINASRRYYDTYKRVARQQSARGLWLGIRLAQKSGDRDGEASYALALSSRFPNSVQYTDYKNAQSRN